MDVRLARLDDLSGIAAIENHAIEHTAASFHTAPRALGELEREWAELRERFPWFVAADDDATVLGFARSGPHKGRCAYGWTAEVSVYVAPSAHRRGIGRALYAALLPTLQAQGVRVATATIALPNPPSVGLHEAFGFRHAGTLRRVGWKLERWHDVGTWQLDLVDDERPPSPVRPVSAVLPARDWA